MCSEFGQASEQQPETLCQGSYNLWLEVDAVEPSLLQLIMIVACQMRSICLHVANTCILTPCWPSPVCPAAPPEYETAPSPRPRFNVYDHSLQGQEAYHAAPGALQKEAVATAAATAGAAAAATAQAEHRPATAAARTEIPAPDGSTAEGVAVVEAPAPSPTSTPPRQGLSQLRPLNSHPLTLNTPESPLTSPRVTAPSSPAMSSMTRSPAVPASPTAAAASDRQGPLHDGLRILPVPSEWGLGQTCVGGGWGCGGLPCSCLVLMFSESYVARLP
jgi:hypothetical protein